MTRKLVPCREGGQAQGRIGAAQMGAEREREGWPTSRSHETDRPSVGQMMWSLPEAAAMGGARTPRQPESWKEASERAAPA